MEIGRNGPGILGIKNDLKEVGWFIINCGILCPLMYVEELVGYFFYCFFMVIFYEVVLEVSNWSF